MSAPAQQANIRQYAKQLRLATIGGQFAQVAEQAIRQKQSHLSYLEALLGAEVEERDRNAVARRIKEAHFPKVKTLEEFTFSDAPHIPVALVRNLAEGGYLNRSEPIIFLGETGTGKTHLATGLAVEACRQRKRVRFTTAAQLVNVLTEAKNKSELNRDEPLDTIRTDRDRRNGLCGDAGGGRGAVISNHCRKSGESGGDRHHESAVFRVDHDVSKRTIVQGHAGPADRPGPHHRDGHGVVPFPQNTGKEERQQGMRRREGGAKNRGCYRSTELPIVVPRRR